MQSIISAGIVNYMAGVPVNNINAKVNVSYNASAQTITFLDKSTYANSDSYAKLVVSVFDKAGNAVTGVGVPVSGAPANVVISTATLDPRLGFATQVTTLSTAGHIRSQTFTNIASSIVASDLNY